MRYLNGTLFSRTDQDDKTRCYLDGLEVYDNQPESYPFSEGRLVFRSGQVHFQYRIADHLGNTVVLFEDKNDDGLLVDLPTDSANTEVLQRKLYYPFGMALRGTSPARPAVRQGYLFNGKEEVAGTGLYAYGLRYYDPVIGRFTGVDPIADQFAWVSTYNYAENSPIGNIDLHGLQKYSFHGLMGIAREQLGRPDEKLNQFFNSTKASPRNLERIELGIKGVKNTVLGVAGTVSAISLAPATTTLGGAATLTILGVSGTSEALVGVSQIADATFLDGDPNSALHLSETLPGVVAHYFDSKYAQLIDAGAQVIPALLHAGIGGVGYDDALEAFNAFKSGQVGKGVFKTLAAKDALGDTYSFGQESKKMIFDGNTSTEPK